ncbi:MAG TPA: DUF3616 domain-containing protein, partial [Polyangia bacterium]|nr:DUF3616 domain-containing protein [Polyangia bacterium]
TAGAGGGAGTAGAGGSAGAGTAGPGGGAGAGGSAGAGTAGAGGSGGAGGSTLAICTSNYVVGVYRVGDGTSSLVNSGNPVFLDGYSGAGNLVCSTPLPTATNGANHRLIASGTATSEGLISRSSDGHYLVLSGYDAALGGSSLSATTSTAVPRVVARLDALGNVDTTTALTDWASANNPRSATSSDGVNIWVAGAAGGIRYTTLGATTSVQLSTTVTNLRQTNIFAGQLYVSDSSGSAVHLGSVGANLPQTAGQTITNLSGFPLTGSPYGFFFADLDGNPGVDTVYVADDGGSTLAGNITKYSLAAGTWTATGSVGTTTDAYRGLTGSVSGGTVTLYATSKGGSGAAGGGLLVMLGDSSGFGGTFAPSPTVLATAAANTAFRGVALAPQ